MSNSQETRNRKCHPCGKTYATPSNLKKHNFQKHASNVQKEGSPNSNPLNVQEGLQTGPIQISNNLNVQKFSCTQCDKAFDTKLEVYHHTANVHGNYPKSLDDTSWYTIKNHDINDKKLDFNCHLQIDKQDKMRLLTKFYKTNKKSIISKRSRIDNNMDFNNENLPIPRPITDQDKDIFVLCIFCNEKFEKWLRVDR